jgi:hypothetical protein
LTQKNNLDALTEKVIALTHAVERITAGQYNDRIAMFYGARQTYIEAIGMENPDNRRIALLNAAKSANDAIATLQQTIQDDLSTLISAKSVKDLDKKTAVIAKCFAKLNDSVQISVNAYAALGENKALLAAVTSYQCFVEQIWLSKILSGKYKGQTLTGIMSESVSSCYADEWRCIPNNIVQACESISQTEHETIKIISDTFENQRTGPVSLAI